MTVKPAPKILVLSLGGTWMMSDVDNVKVATALGSKFSFNDEFPEVRRFCDVKFIELMSIDSSNMAHRHWALTAKSISANYQAFDGFVVLQGTDTLAYSAAALSFSLRNLGKPVVLTGSQISKSEPFSDARTNVINACRLAASEHRNRAPGSILCEVAIVFGSKVIRGTRARKFSENDLEAFDSVNIPLLGRIRLDIDLDRNVLSKPAKGVHFTVAPEFDPHVALVYLFPGLRPEVLTSIGQASSGVVLAAFGAGNVPSGASANALALDNAIESLGRSGVPVVVTTQCVTGQAEMALYDTGQAAQRSGAIIANDMTPECALVKLSWVLANQQHWPRRAERAGRGGPGWLGAIKIAMLHNFAGEIAQNRPRVAKASPGA